MATSPNATQITPPRVPIIDERTGAVSREWYRWFYSLYNIVGTGTGVIPVASGGTGLSTIPTNGQLLIGNGTGYTLNTLGVGAGISVTNGLGTITVANTGVLSNIAGSGISVSSATGNVTIANTGVLSFAGGTTGLTPAAATTGVVTLAGTLIAANGGTGFASYAVGDLLYADTTTTLAKLPDVATGNALISGGVITAPAWGKIGLTTHVSGILPIANGGTNGSATPTTNGVAYGTGTTYAFTAAGTTGQVLTATTGGAPTWAAPATSGTVTSVSVVSANGFAGTVATATTTPAITLTTTITGVLKGNGTAISAAVVNTDYFAPSAPATKVANFTVADTEVWLINNKTGSTCTVTLPTASSWTGRVLRFQNYQVQAVVSASSNVVPLTGGAAGTSILLASSGDAATLVSDGSNWLMTQYIPNNILLLE
jgi:hypothetical protein